MRRPRFGPPALVLALAGLVIPPTLAVAQTPEQMAQTARFLAALQNPDGGFAAKAGGPSSLGATSSIMRSLKNVGGSIPDALKCIEYVKSCRDAESGGFAQTQGGQPDVGTTASGLMALGELRIADKEAVEKAVQYLAEHAKTFAEIRIAVAGLEAVGAKSDAFPKWIEQVNSDRNPDGTWGEGDSQAFATGGAAVALLRMGVDLDKKDKILEALRAGQQPDGGWTEKGGESGLSPTYRIMRCFFMLKASPDLDRLESFLMKHRQSDGGYASKPGGASEPGATYFCTTVGRWVRILKGEPAVVETAGFQPLFDGKTLDGWEGDKDLWSVRDGMLVGKSPGISHNDFLATTKGYRDFILKFSFRLVNGEGNSGVQFRSVRVPGHEMSGYQADIGQGFWGCLYDESRRNKVLVQARDDAKEAVNKDGWNHYVVRAMGNHITLMLNGKLSADYREDDPDIARDGKVAVQIHAGGPMEVQFKDMYIQELPTPTADDATTPGFHLRTLKTADGDRKYTVFFPVGYDGKKAFPVVLFLHGAGERGEDGVTCAQVGLGAAINQHPEDYPFIAVFPQARRTWAADSDDAKAALAALDEVVKSSKVDGERAILTGLSMGRMGSWSVGSAHPERFSALAPVCGFGRDEWASALKDTPIWTLMGDADMDRIVEGTRSMVAALRKAGASPKETEYRGVGHNSWDRAYSDPALIDWMLAQRRTK